MATEAPAAAPAPVDEQSEAQKKYLQDLAKAVAEQNPSRLDELLKHAVDVGVTEQQVEFARVAHKRLVSQDAKQTDLKQAKAKLRRMRRRARAKLKEAVQAKKISKLKQVAYLSSFLCC